MMRNRLAIKSRPVTLEKEKEKHIAQSNENGHYATNFKSPKYPLSHPASKQETHPKNLSKLQLIIKYHNKQGTG